MVWRMTNIKLQKGAVFPVYGDSAPLFRIFVVNRADFCKKSG